MLDELAPWGEGNPEPVFEADALVVSSPPRVVGRGTGHLSLMLKGGGTGVKAIGFGMGPRVSELWRGATVRVAYTPRISEYRGFPELELDIKDLQVRA
jgi:single-stranded-DNA-specific exonuclease